MLDRPGQAAVVLVPEPGAAVQFEDRVWAFAPQAFAQESGEKMMVTVIAALIIQGHQEQVTSLQPFEHLPPICPVGERLAQWTAQGLHDGGLEQELPNVLRLAGEDLVGQVVENEASATSSMVHGT